MEKGRHSREHHRRLLEQVPQTPPRESATRAGSTSNSMARVNDWTRVTFC